MRITALLLARVASRRGVSKTIFSAVGTAVVGGDLDGRITERVYMFT